ncbi:chemotaxis response regulator protein-glutamate methylesterase of group 1 operon [Flavobacteriaceae bacterium UJ101]|nr:chemotaxis response regulator protein-glutamate methylesterase of group 1 operon [Flavobacteriaceae bacterium UJ101]
MKVIIIDDDVTSRLVLRKLCSKIDDIEIIGEYENPLEAMPILDENRADLIFLDIHMPELSGIDFLKISKSLPYTILITSDPNFALEAYEYNVTDYLLKPIDTLRFLKAIEKVKSLTASLDSEKSGSEEIYINVDRRLVRLMIDEINIVEAKGDYVMIRTSEKNYIVHSTMKNIEKKLPSHTFIKVHRSYIINKDRIVDIKDNSVLINKDVVPISRSNKETLMKSLNMI